MTFGNNEKLPVDIFHSVEKQVLLARKLEKAYSNRPELSNFIGAMPDTKFAPEYTEESIRNDEQYVETTRKNIEQSIHSRGERNAEVKEANFAVSEMMQALIVDRINNGWLDEFSAIMTSDFDDLKSGIDAIMKHKSGQYVGAAFDFTSAADEEVLRNKLDKEWERRIEKGSIPTVKYFEDPDTHAKGKILAPKFVIGATRKDIEELADAYLENKEEVLKEHKFQYLIIEQVYEQLVAILDYYDKHNTPENTFATKHYEGVYVFVQRMRDRFVSEGKINTIEFYEYAKESPALQIMREFRLAKVQ
jgi:hypothetical protein